MDLKFQTQLDKSGRVTIPPEIISELHLNTGMILGIEEKDGTITIESNDSKPTLIEKDGILVLHAQLTEDISDIVEKNRDNRIMSIIKDSLK